VAPAPAPVVHDYDWVVAVYEHYQNHDDVWLTAFAQDGHTNYFGKRHASNLAIALDMRNDALHYGRWKATYYVDTFYRDVTQGITYDHIDMESSVYEYGVRWHSARVRFTVGYTYDGSVPRIYALVYQVL
jgi:hypothetical protein